jgi:hypothetical protein
MTKDTMGLNTKFDSIHAKEMQNSVSHT